MERQKIRFVDRLRDRGFVDQWAFIIFATIGFAAIVSGKWLGLETVWIALGAVLLMLIYALVVGWSGTGRVRADQAGDNCYYLGLIYTLASLSYAIGTFDPNDTASTIVQGFGIALATTIFGLILRVFFSQGRPDLENTEEQARLELTEASSRLKTELVQVVGQMNDFSFRLQQSLRETHAAAADSMEAFTTTSVDGLKSVVDTANEAIRGEANDFAARAKKYDASFAKLLTNIEAHSESLDGIAMAHDKLREAAEVTQGAVAQTNSALEGLMDTAKETKGAIADVRESSNITRQSAENMSQAISEVEKGLRLITSETEKQLESLRLGPGETVVASLAALNEATSTLSTELAKISSAHHDLTTDLSEQAKIALATAREHTNALSDELAKSRKATMQVHGDLVATTDKIARHVERLA